MSDNLAIVQFCIQLPHDEARDLVNRINSGAQITVDVQDPEDEFDQAVNDIVEAGRSASTELTRIAAQPSGPLIPTIGGVLAGEAQEDDGDGNVSTIDTIGELLDEADGLVEAMRDNLDDLEEEVMATFANNTTVAQVGQIRIDGAHAHLTLFRNELQLLRGLLGRN